MTDSPSDRNSKESGRERPTFRAVFEAEASYVCHVVRRFGIPERDVEDVAHDVFVAVHRKLEDYDPNLPIKPWLFGIAYRVAVAHRRRKMSLEEVTEELPEVVDDAPLPDQRMDVERGRRLVLRALEFVEPERRAVLILHDIDGVAIPEVAAALEIPLNTAYSRLRLAREEFTKAARRLQKGRER